MFHAGKYPTDLLDMPQDDKEFGELDIEIVRGFLETVRFYEHAMVGFPFEVFEQAITDFRDGGMITTSKPVSRDIIGTAVKAEFVIQASPSETAIILTLKKGRKRFFSKQVGSLRGGLADNALILADVTLVPRALEDSGISFPLSEPYRIEFSELPEGLVAILRSETT